ncbi:protein OPI10 homolog [Dioscorea cayenensis subsp. rotundata]|uniref:Protein OPI10 homolog n=1 Tax=Dioscorea cayennensis subsp. rotundata TaxID=55577 RepID=A0AB40D0K8_DIOCR|nr:protein OPI10 homolog [Dioscorea cayenensis subsp. rotundata]
MFGVVFPELSFPMDISSFSQIDPFHWLLDLSSMAGEAYHSVKELCIFLLNPNSLPAGKALAVYAQPPSGPFLFCGALHGSRPSALLRLPWPDPADVAATPAGSSAKIGVSIEDLAALPAVADAGKEEAAARVALKVGENLFNFMQSFCGVDGNRLVVPMDILDQWFKKFQERSRKDPTYLKAFGL